MTYDIPYKHLTQTPTDLQTKLSRIRKINQNYGYISPLGNDAAKGAASTISSYTSMQTVPSVEKARDTLNALYEARAKTTSAAQYNAINQVIINLEMEILSYNRQGFIPLNSHFPAEEIGVTYSTIKDDLLSVLRSYPENDSAELLASDIYDIIKVENPELSYNQLVSDIQATVNINDMGASSLRNMLANNVDQAELSQTSLSNAFFGNDSDHLLSVGFEQLVNDLVESEERIRMDKVLSSLIDVCSSSYVNSDEFSSSLYNVLSSFGLQSYTLNIESLKNDADASAAVQGSLENLVSNLKSNLDNLDISFITENDIKNAIFTANGVVFAAPYDFTADIADAQQNRNLENIYNNLKNIFEEASTNGMESDDLADAIIDATKNYLDVVENTDGHSLEHDIEVSNTDVKVLASNILANLSALSYPYTAEGIVSAIFNDDNGIQQSDRYDFISDLQNAQRVRNYGALSSELSSSVTQVFTGGSNYDLANAIKQKIGPNSNLSLIDLIEDVEATVNTDPHPDINALISAISSRLDGLEGEGLNASNIADAVYDHLISANKFEFKNDLETQEQVRDYAKLINDLKAASSACNTNPDLATFASNVQNAIKHFGGSITLPNSELLNDMVGGAYEENDGNSAQLASNIYTALSSLLPASANAQTVAEALYGEGKIVPGTPHNLKEDITKTEQQINYVDIKKSLISVCNQAPAMSVDSFANAIAAALTNRTGALSASKLAKDITASIDGTTLNSLANAIKASLEGLSDDQLNTNSIVGALYNANRIFDANKYDMKKDVMKKEAELQLLQIVNEIKTKLLNLINSASEDNPVGDSDVAYAIVKGVNAYPATLTQGNLINDISYTFAEDDLRATSRIFAVNPTQSYSLASALYDSLNSINNVNAPSVISAKIFASNLIVQNPSIIGRSDVDSFRNDLITRRISLANSSPKIDTVASLIWSGLHNLGSASRTNNQNIADTIVNAMGLSSPLLLSSELKADLDLNTLNYNYILNSFGGSSEIFVPLGFTTAGALVNNFYQTLPTTNTVNKDALAYDVDSSVANTNSYVAIASKIKTELEIPGSEATASQLADIIINGAWYLSMGTSASNYLKESERTTLKSNVLADISTSGDLSQLKSNIQQSLYNYIQGGTHTASGLVDAIYASNVIISSDSNKNKMMADIANAVTQGYSYKGLAMELTNIFGIPYHYNHPSSIDSLGNLVVYNILADNNVETTLSPSELKADLQATYAQSSGFPMAVSSSLVSLLQSNTYISAEDIADAIYDHLIDGRTNRNQLVSDITNYATTPSRVASYYQAIANDLMENAAGSVSSEVAASFVSQLGQETELLASRLAADIDYTATQHSSSVEEIMDAVKNALDSLGLYSDETIKDAVFSNNALLVAPTDKTNLVADVSYGYQNGLSVYAQGMKPNTYTYIAKLIYDSLSNPGFDNMAMASQIVSAVTPYYQTDSDLDLVVSNIARDIEYSLSLAPYSSMANTDAISALASSIRAGFEGSTFTTSSGVKDVLYHSGRIVAATDEANNFYNDLVNTLEGMNEFPTIKSQLTTTVSSVDPVLIVDEFESSLPHLSTYRISQGTFLNDLTNNQELLAAIASRIGTVSVDSSEGAALAIASAVYEGFTAYDHTALAADIKAANDVDDTQTDRSAIGTYSACADGEPHKVYSCNAEGQVGYVISTNDCTITGRMYAESQCRMWSNNPGADLYASYTNSNEGCSALLGVHALEFCLAGLDPINIG